MSGGRCNLRTEPSLGADAYSFWKLGVAALDEIAGDLDIDQGDYSTALETVLANAGVDITAEVLRDLTVRTGGGDVFTGNEDTVVFGSDGFDNIRTGAGDDLAVHDLIELAPAIRRSRATSGRDAQNKRHQHQQHLLTQARHLAVSSFRRTGFGLHHSKKGPALRGRVAAGPSPAMNQARAASAEACCGSSIHFPIGWVLATFAWSKWVTAD